MLFHSTFATNFLPLFLLFFLSTFAANLSQACHQTDRDTLLSFSFSFSSSSPLNWSSSSDCCSWKGISCDGSNNRVIRIHLPSAGLKGNISPTFQNLTFLSHLNLSRNFLSGPLPHSFFTALNHLHIVDFSSNRLSGELPSSSILPVSIQTVDLSSNSLTGTIPTSFLQSASNLTSFNVRNNSFTGPIPPSICTTSPSVKFLDFSANKFTSQIPTGFGSCSKLEIFRAGSNKLEGSVPFDIYSAASLQEIFLPANKLNGPLHEGIANLTNLRVFNVFGNGFVGPIPDNIEKLSKLEELHLHINNLTGTIPMSLMNCTNLRILNLRVNKFHGKLSDLDFSRLSKLTTLDLGNNNFTGTLPETLFSCKSLVALRLARNQLGGQISPNLVGLQSLSFLSVSVNNLTNVTGAISVLVGCKNLTTLVLTENFFHEEMPGDVDLVDGDSFKNIQVLALSSCHLTGRIPGWLAKLKKLEVVDLSYNKLTGIIPGWLGNYSNLFYLDLSFNSLEGGFPLELTRLPRLTSVRNDQINESILELPVFVIPDNISLFQYNQLDSLPPAIYLESNSLSGNIPVEVGLLKFLHVLDLSYNNFSGSIPDQLSNLTNLEHLNLSVNDLSGEIPASLRVLHFLSKFSVANNSLQGPIPTGGQFDTFPNTSFEGNPLLCGPVLHVPCSFKPDTGRPSRQSKRSPKKKIVTGLVIGICLGVGFTLITLAVCILTKESVLRKTDKVNAGSFSLRSNSGFSSEFEKDASLVMVFPNNTAEIKNLSIQEILKATGNFNQENIIGCGGFGLVYKATLENGTKLAVKKLSGDMGLMEREFRAEVEALSTAQHRNLVTLQGYCIHDGFRILIYSYMVNGSLDYWLHETVEGRFQLDWPTRMRILQGTGCGLAYMHQICEPHIVHRDIKSSNILLDEKFEAHVADFGLSRLILPYQTHVTTELVGTLGYIPPEYGQAWIATLRGDMYSFGVVMLELLTRKRPVEVFKPKESRELVVWVQQLRREGRQDEVFDPLLKGKGFEEEMTQVLDVACMCVNQNPFKRPTITEVVDWLEKVGANRETPK